MLTKILVSVGFWLFYWFCCFLGTGTDKKNLAGLRSYPDAVQKAVRENPVIGKDAPPEKSHYQDPGKHIGSFLRGIPLFALAAVLAAGIVAVLG